MKFFPMLAAALVIMGTTAFAAEHSHSHAAKPADPHAHAHEEAAAEKGHEDLTLIQVMHDLASNLNRIQWGIMTNNRYMVEQGAAGISSHPMGTGDVRLLQVSGRIFGGGSANGHWRLHQPLGAQQRRRRSGSGEIAHQLPGRKLGDLRQLSHHAKSHRAALRILR